ncbi:glycyl-radical enzyme activating protein [Atopobacter phocae]|uniref:glycyl-radical enzyme activating protein n=1 Tax=Atopobacter phocae TaxID=136492 RepID=UPI00046F85DE|nr:glycyl-radical enzyme activating protein [Atopobacter phocae]
MNATKEATACIFNIQKFSIHDGPGIRTVVFFKGCPLRCYWCANPESQNRKPEKIWSPTKNSYTTVGEYKTVDEIVDVVMKDLPFYEESGGGVTLSGGEVLLQGEFAIELLKKLKTLGINTAAETTGFAKSDLFQTFISYIDHLYFDFKHHDSLIHKKGIGTGNEQIIKNLAYAVEHHPDLTVRIPIIPNYNNSLEDANSFASILSEIGVKYVELLPFHQFGEKKYDNLNRDYSLKDVPQLHSEDLVEIGNIFKENQIDCLIR